LLATDIRFGQSSWGRLEDRASLQERVHRHGRIVLRSREERGCERWFDVNCACGSGDFEGDREVERRAVFLGAVQPDLASHHVDQRRRDRQAEARPAEPPRRRSVRLAEGLEDREVLVRRHADSCVADHEVHPGTPDRAAVLADLHEHMPAFGELDGVGDEVPQHLLQPAGVADDHGRYGVTDAHVQLEPLLIRTHREASEELGHDVAWREGDHLQLELPRFDLGEVQNVVHDCQQ